MAARVDCIALSMAARRNLQGRGGQSASSAAPASVWCWLAQPPTVLRADTGHVAYTHTPFPHYSCHQRLGVAPAADGRAGAPGGRGESVGHPLLDRASRRTPQQRSAPFAVDVTLGRECI